MSAGDKFRVAGRRKRWKGRSEDVQRASKRSSRAVCVFASKTKHRSRRTSPKANSVANVKDYVAQKKQSLDCFFLYIQKVNLPGEADVDDGLAQLGDVLGAATVYADVASSVIEGGVDADVTVTRDRVVFHAAAGEP